MLIWGDLNNVDLSFLNEELHNELEKIKFNPIGNILNVVNPVEKDTWPWPMILKEFLIDTVLIYFICIMFI